MLNSCLGKWHLLPYLVVPLISARIPLISTRVSTHCQAIGRLGRRQAIIWTDVGILLNGTLGIYFSEILSEIHTFSFKEIHLKMSSAKRRPFCLGLNVLMEVMTTSPKHWLTCFRMTFEDVLVSTWLQLATNHFDKINVIHNRVQSMPDSLVTMICHRLCFSRQ